VQEKQKLKHLLLKEGGREAGGRAQQNKLLLLLLENDYSEFSELRASVIYMS
jgi:hypothetical protein